MKFLWDIWEIKAIEYLKSKGYKILTTNYKFGRIGEVDIIASIDQTTVFFEVKLRTSSYFWEAWESINFSKREKIYKTILSYIQKYKIWEDSIRFDIILIQWSHIEHYEGCELL